MSNGVEITRVAAMAWGSDALIRHRRDASDLWKRTGDEGVDAAYFFGKQHGLSSKEFRESLLAYLCTQEGV